MYQISSFNDYTGEMTFLLADGSERSVILTKEFPDYRGITSHFYIDTSNREVVVLPDIYNRVCTIIEGVLYQRCSQYEYDKYCDDSNQDNDNAKIYGYLTK